MLPANFSCKAFRIARGYPEIGSLLGPTLGAWAPTLGGGTLSGGARAGSLYAPPPPPPPPHPTPPLSAQVSATTKRGCRPWAGSPWGPGNRGADLLLPPPPPKEMGPDRKQAQHPPPPPRMPSHPHCRPSHGDRGPSGSGRRATSMLGSGTRMVTQQVVLLSHTSEQVDPSTTLPPPPPPACVPDGRGARSRRPQGLKSGGCEGLTA